MPNELQGLLGGMQATPRNKLMGLLADGLKAADRYANKPDPTMPGGKANPPLSLLSDLASLKSLAEVANNVSYGYPLTNAGVANVPFLKPETADALMMAPISPRNALAAASMGIGIDGAVLHSAITPMTRQVLRGMSKDEFLGAPRIVGKADASDLRPKALNSLLEVQPEPFMGGKFTAKYSPDGAVVFDGDKPIASYNFGDTLVVDPKYRKKGIGEELVYQQRTYFPEPAKANTRNKASQHIQENVWDRIQGDLQSLP